MNKHQSLKSAQSLLERASSLYGFDTAMRSKTAKTQAQKPADKPAENADENAAEKLVQTEIVAPPINIISDAKKHEEEVIVAPVIDQNISTTKEQAIEIAEPKDEFVTPALASVARPVPTPSKRDTASDAKPLPMPTKDSSEKIPPVATQAAAQTIAPIAKSAASASRNTIRKIDRQWLSDNNMIVPDGPVTSLSEEFRIVKRQLLLAARGGKGVKAVENGERILICSANPNEGKTYTSANLALSLASEKDNRVLLIDADFAKPSILSTLNIEGGPGLMDALADPNLDVNEMVLETDVDGLSVLPAGSQSNQDTEYLAAARTAKVIEKLSQDDPNRIIIFDSPPALAASPASVLALHVGQTLMVVHADKTTDSALRDALNLLSGCDYVQLLLNRANFSPSGRKFGSYYGYGA